ncbi:MAG: hypothetical protein QNJ98_10000 [Planctomycetota bacterium]|nr:hypothetical protein [Planctomycetota bacterium]
MSRGRGPAAGLLRARTLVPLLALALLGTAPAGAQELVTRDGKVHTGHVFPGAQEVRLNPYGSSAPEMTLGIRTFRARDVQEVREDPTPAGFRRQLLALPAGDVGARVRLLRWAQTRRLRPEIQRAAAEVLRVDAANEEALKAIKGKRKWEALKRGHPVLDRALVLGLRRLLRMESGAARRAAAKRLEASTGAKLPAHLVERMARSLTADRGLTEGIALTLDAAEYPGATYDLFVPADYDPVEPRPLLLALHGGGILRSVDGKVIGSSRDAMAVWLDEARKAGWILVAPTAVEGPWTTSRNERYLDAVLAEVTALWSVDLERMHLAGNGGGGDGVWAYAAGNAARFASVGVASAGDPKGYVGIAQKSGLWLYHGDEDEIVPVDPVRKAAERLRKSKTGSVYCELPGEKHGVPPAAVRDYIHFANPRRRKKPDSPWPLGSFTKVPTEAEVLAFGDPAGGWGLTLDADLGADALVAVLQKGQLDAEPAARRLAAADGARAAGAPRLRALVKDREAPLRARTWAAWVLGRWRDAEALNVLGDVLRSERDAELLRRAADAVGRIANPDNQEDLRFALRDLSGRYKALKGRTIPFVEYERACRLGAALAMAMGRVGKAAEVQADIEEALVIGILRDRRPVIHRRENGENPTALKAWLAESLGRAYRAMGADPTVRQMLITVLRRDPEPRAAAAKGLREGLPPLK